VFVAQQTGFEEDGAGARGAACCADATAPSRAKHAATTLRAMRIVILSALAELL
jgi:hypothetical protein